LFAALAAFDQLRFPLLFYPMALAQLSQAQVSAARIETFLGMKEVGKGSGASGNGIYNRDEKASAGEIQVEDATIYWSDPNVPTAKPEDDDSSVSSKSIASKRSTGSNSKSTTIIGTDFASAELSTTGSDSGLVYPKPVLDNVTFQVKPGELCAVVGRVASGKSTLCSSVLNETVLGSGSVTLKGKVAYAAQSPWILNATLRDNILFGLPMDRVKYDRVLEACQLSYDLELLENGDLTEIGERGINLSGGQKQRVSVARAAYSDADTIILDDPLSALDPEVGKKMFDDCVVKLMHGKTRLLVTNQLQFLQYCDNIVALGHRKVLEQGNFSDLTAKEGGEVQRILNDLAAGKESVRQSTSDGKSDKKAKNDKKAEGAADAAAPQQQQQKDNKGLVTKEERNVGAVAAAVYRKYLIAGGGYGKFALVYFAFILSAANNLAGVSWVSYWTSDSEYEKHSQAFYLGMYGLLAFTLGFFTYVRTYLLVRFGVAASENLHSGLLNSMLGAPQSFFDTTPIGRILSRFSKDVYSIDVELSEYLDFFMFMSLQVVVSIGTIIFVTPYFAIAVIPLGFVYFKVLNYFRNVARETKRLESVSRSPVYAQFSESLGGLATIRAYGQGTRFMDEFEGKVDQNIRAWYCNKSADRWLSVRLEMIGACVAGLAATFATNVAISGSVSGQVNDGNFASLAGLSLIFAISVTGLLNWCVRSFAQLEAAMNACERVLYYTQEIPQEAPHTSKGLEDRANSSTNPQDPADPSTFAVVAKGGKANAIPSSWPDKGEITLNNLKMRYRKDTPLVLKGLSVSIAGGERIGVVGRTGSGKSSLLLTLLRLVEPSLEDVNAADYEPPLTIDGVDTLRVGLKELRSKLGIIPQNPVLFSGTIRSNIDPFDEYTDDQIWAALERCGMKEAVMEMPAMLGATVSEYGENLSAGMRQMLVLGRALLKQCRILLLDEATSSVDYETDREIQRTIREAFTGCTVLTIAHRINTIMDSDKILVMKDGMAAEFAPPQELLQDENSIFSDIVRHSQQEEN
jgi:ATP-binding cassette subfamily C (CFTR/MRP) protein 1